MPRAGRVHNNAEGWSSAQHTLPHRKCKECQHTTMRGVLTPFETLYTAYALSFAVFLLVFVWLVPTVVPALKAGVAWTVTTYQTTP